MTSEEAASLDAARFRALKREWRVGFFIAGNRDEDGGIFIRFEGWSLAELADSLIVAQALYDYPC